MEEASTSCERFHNLISWRLSSRRIFCFSLFYISINWISLGFVVLFAACSLTLRRVVFSLKPLTRSSHRVLSGACFPSSWFSRFVKAHEWLLADLKSVLAAGFFFLRNKSHNHTHTSLVSSRLQLSAFSCCSSSCWWSSSCRTPPTRWTPSCGETPWVSDHM